MFKQLTRVILLVSLGTKIGFAREYLGNVVDISTINIFYFIKNNKHFLPFICQSAIFEGKHTIRKKHGEVSVRSNQHALPRQPHSTGSRLIKFP
jgi:hypothetical protein